MTLAQLFALDTATVAALTPRPAPGGAFNIAALAQRAKHG